MGITMTTHSAPSRNRQEERKNEKERTKYGNVSMEQYRAM